MLIHLLLATSLTCSEATDLIKNMRSYKVEESTKSEMIQIVKDETSYCGWHEDAKAD